MSESYDEKPKGEEGAPAPKPPADLGNWESSPPPKPPGQ